jgi:hypothetical protein
MVYELKKLHSLFCLAISDEEKKVFFSQDSEPSTEDRTLWRRSDGRPGPNVMKLFTPLIY